MAEKFLTTNLIFKLYRRLLTVQFLFEKIEKCQIQSDILAQPPEYMGDVQKYQISHWLAVTLGIITDLFFNIAADRLFGVLSLSLSILTKN